MSDALEGQIEDARRQMRRLQVVVDLACAAIRSGAYTRAECLDVIEACRRWAAKLCPDRPDLFEMIYARRMERLIDRE